MTKTQMGLRIETLILKSGLKKSEIAKQSGTDYQTLQRLISGRVKWPRSDLLQNLADTLKTTVNYILHGRGFEIPEMSNKIPVLTLDLVHAWCKNTFKAVLDEKHPHILNPFKEYEDSENFFAIKIYTDAMESKGGHGIPKGSYAICKPTSLITPNKYIIFHDTFDKSSCLREAIIEDNTYLKPLNPRYKIKKKGREIQAIGEVIGVLNCLN